MNLVSDPSPQFDDWNFGELLNKGIRPLAELEPYKVALMIADEVDNLVNLKMEHDLSESIPSRDFSENWCPKLEEPRREHAESEESLVHTLTYACRQVYERESPETVESLDRVLRSKRWDVFERIRQYLYSLYPNKQTLPWIKEFVLEYEDYVRGWRYPYEFQLMVRRACEELGASLLTKDEKTRIFEIVLTGPSKEEHREWMGEQYSDEAFEEWVPELQRMLLRPFASVLFGKYADYYRNLEKDKTLQPITDESYLRNGTSKGGFVTNKSHISPDDLSKLTDTELLELINDWDDEHYEKNDFLIQVSIQGLSDAFQSVFKLQIIPDSERLQFWVEKGPLFVKRSIYVQCMLKAMRVKIESGSLVNLDEFLRFCELVLQSTKHGLEENIKENGNEVDSRKWEACRREVVDFIEVCVKEETNVPIAFRNQLAGLLEALCTQFDWDLDNNVPTLLDRDDPITEAINHTRSRALDKLFDFGFWVRTFDETAEVFEVVEILERRIQLDSTYSLSIPEFAIFGKNIGRIFNLDRAWLSDHLSTFFPRSPFVAWQASFESFLHFNHPNRMLFELVENEYVFAIENLDGFKFSGQFMGDAVETLGEHLFTYYMWGIYPLLGESSLLERYYIKTSNNHNRWARLFDYVGRSLSGVRKEQLTVPIISRLMGYFEWRLSAKVPEELREFSFWLEAKCLEVELRTNSYLRILDVSGVLVMETGKPRYAAIHTISLCEMLPDHSKEVIECFSKLVATIPSQDLIYIPPDEAKSILVAGFRLDNDEAIQQAEDTRETLLRAGHFELSELEIQPLN